MTTETAMVSSVKETRSPVNQNLQWLLLLALLAAGFGVRMLNLKDPPVDYHPVRQLRSALIARAVFYELNTSADPALRGMAIALGTTDIHEPPIYEQVVGLAYSLIGSEQVWIARIFSSLFWLIGGVALFALARRHTSFWAALVGLAFFLCLPFGIVASRSFQPDPWMIMWILLTAWSADHWMESAGEVRSATLDRVRSATLDRVRNATPNWKWSILTGVFGGIAILVKVMAGFFIAGILVLAVLSTFHWRQLFRTIKPWVMAVIVLSPAVIYYLVMHTGRAEEYFTYWTLGFSNMLLTSKFYVQWLAMINSLTGLTLLAIALLGVVVAAPRFRWILIGLWIGYVLFGMVWPFQYTTHDYYHLALIPTIGLSITPVADVLLKKLSLQGWLWRLGGIAVILAAAGFQLFVGRSQLIANDFSAEPRSWQKVGEAIPAGASFVALTNDYGLRLNYFGWRNASYYWPGEPDLELSDLRGNEKVNPAQRFKDVTQGKSYFLVTALGELDKQPELKAILQTYSLHVQGSGWMVYDLTKPKTQ
jgi:4-amino-4-deoxy-L-arabinose transferase-like glycosyltransferase